MARFLIERCSLTDAQLDTVLISTTSGSLESKAKHRDIHEVSRGAFVRTLRQGQANIEASIYTLFLVQYLGLVGPENLQKLSKLADLISRVRDSSPDADSLERLVGALEDFAEGFSRKRKFIV